MRSPFDNVNNEAHHDDWRMEAACLDLAPELFFPVGGSEEAMIQLYRAKRVCAACPVQAACLQWAERKGITHGVWGGLSEDERRSLKRRTQRQRQGTHSRAGRSVDD
jgi:WhiB family redox-sensing transcriptional regulator